MQILNVLYGLSATAGGKTRVAIKRSHMFHMRGLYSLLVILEYDEHLIETIHNMKLLKIIDENQEIINPYLYYAGVVDSTLRYHKHKKAEFIDTSSFMSSKIFLKKEIHNDKSYSLLYFTQHNSLFFIERFNKNKKCINVKIILSNKIISLKGRSAFYRRFFQDIALNHTKTMIIIDSEGAFRHITNLNKNNNNIYTCVNFHRNHFKAPFSFGSQIESKHLRVLDNCSNIDALVVLTETQRRDIKNQFKEIENIFVIPNHITTQQASGQQLNRDNNLIVAVGRLTLHKNFTRGIEIFSEVVKSIPDARLEIWGDGSEESKLIEKIKALSLENHVFLCGHTNDIHSVFSRARVSLCTSRSEGFSLTVLESLTYGTPVVSFNILGPCDIISNGINGFVCDDDATFIEKTIQIMTNDSLYLYLQDHTKNVFDKFSQKIVYKQWTDLFNTIEKSRSSSAV